jgi:hypothetical protein
LKGWQKAEYFRWNYFPTIFPGGAGDVFISSEYTGSMGCLVINERENNVTNLLAYFEVMPQYLCRRKTKKARNAFFRTGSLWAEI